MSFLCICKNISDCLFSLYSSISLTRREGVRLRFEDDPNDNVAHIYRKHAGLDGNNRTGGPWRKEVAQWNLLK